MKTIYVTNNKYWFIIQIFLSQILKYILESHFRVYSKNYLVYVFTINEVL